MKKILGLILSIALVFSLAACGNSKSSEVSESGVTESTVVSKPESVRESSSTETAGESTTLDEEMVESESEKTLVVYFSMPETTDPDNMTCSACLRQIKGESLPMIRYIGKYGR